MRIAIDASRTTVPRRTGTENYALQMIVALLALDSPHHFDLYFRDEPPPDLLPVHTQITEHVIPFPRLWTHVRFATALWRSRPDLTWVPAHTLPRFFPGRGIITIHDLGYLHFPEAHPEKERRYLDWSTRYSARRASAILADSIATKADLSERCQIPPEKIHIVYPGVDENMVPVRDETSREIVRQRYDLPPRYLLFLGTLQPRKNIARLVEAFVAWRQESDHKDVVLALGGKPGWLYDSTWTAGAENVRILGYVDDADIAVLYSCSLGLVMPSLYEGFGFPVIEAMRCEVPVLCSNTSSMPELAGDAAVLVDPESVASISAGIRNLVENESLRQSLVERGKVQAAKFTWEAAASQVLAVFEKVL